MDEDSRFHGRESGVRTGQHLPFIQDPLEIYFLFREYFQEAHVS